MCLQTRFSHIFVIFLCLWEVRGHAALYEPPNRSSVWRFPEFQQFHPVVNTDDCGGYCGGFAVHHEQNHGKCGICGDNYAQRTPRDNESGGKYGLGIIVRNYTAGQEIFTSTHITANHLGYFEFSLCPRNSTYEPETDACFEQYPLPRSDGMGSKSYPVDIGGTVGYFNVTVSLPPKIFCSQCVLRWQYITGNSWGICGVQDGPEGPVNVTGIGCGPQEEFRGCADIAIFS